MNPLKVIVEMVEGLLEGGKEQAIDQGIEKIREE